MACRNFPHEELAGSSSTCTCLPTLIYFILACRLMKLHVTHFHPFRTPIIHIHTSLYYANTNALIYRCTSFSSCCNNHACHDQIVALLAGCTPGQGGTCDITSCMSTGTVGDSADDTSSASRAAAAFAAAMAAPVVATALV